MFAWIAENIGTVVVCAVLLAAVTAIVVGMVKKKKKGVSACGCNCGCCPMNGKCH